MSEELPGQVLDSHCPACSRYVGPEENCPYCGVDGIKPLPFRLFKRLSILLAIVGVSILGIAAHKTQPPIMPITNITPLMNHATVSIEGTVTRKPSTSAHGRNAYVGMIVNDGSGEIKVNAYGSVAEDLIESDHLPGRGDTIRLTGSLDIRGATRKQLILRSAEQVQESGNRRQAEPAS